MGGKTLTADNAIVISVSSKYHLKDDKRVHNLIRVLLEQWQSRVTFIYCERDVNTIKLTCRVQPQFFVFAKDYCNSRIKDVEGKEMYGKAC